MLRIEGKWSSQVANSYNLYEYKSNGLRRNDSGSEQPK